MTIWFALTSYRMCSRFSSSPFILYSWSVKHVWCVPDF
uniref:Uncharacterized protein n=1 Tax=Arundo donax TaxID=35708 RepID=A0A0A9E8S1_ARUDO